MTTTYRIGVTVVLSAVALAGVISSLFVNPRPSVVAADPDSREARLGRFTLKERSGREVTSDDLSRRVWIASFIFTRCPSSCPRIVSTLKSVQPRLVNSRIQTVCLSVDPERDTPEVLRKYAESYGADPDRWWFLTGEKAVMSDLVLNQFRVPLQENDPSTLAPGMEEISHSARLALVDLGNKVVEYANAEDFAAVDALIQHAKRLDQPVIRSLPAVNASLNGASALLISLGWLMIRRRRIKSHIGLMIAALTVSALFLACYLIYHYNFGSTPFRGIGPVRQLYFTILLSHTALAVAMVPLILMTVTQAARRRFERHRAIASLTFPIWIYVSVTGVVVYWMLYQMPV